MKIEMTGKSRTMKTKTGNDMIICEGYAHIVGAKYPQQIELIAPKGAQAWGEGMYTLDPASVVIGDYKSLEIRPVLVPIQAGK
ncbi:MAG: single-stranded DNA-binding protein [Panacagrimonas sp.]